MNKALIIILVAAVVGGAFYGGIKYSESKQSTNFAPDNFRNLSPEERQQRFQGIGPVGNRQAGAEFVSGEIIAKDNESVTVKLRDGGSKIIFLFREHEN